MAKAKVKAPAPAVKQPRKKPAAAKAAHAQLQRVYQENGFLGLPDQRRIDFPASAYRNHPGLIAAVAVLAIALIAALIYIVVSFSGAARPADDLQAYDEPAAQEEIASPEPEISNLEVPAAPEAPADSLASWVTYQDTGKTFEFKYSPTWQANQAEPQIVNFSLTASTGTTITANWKATSTNLNAYLLALDKASAKAWEGKPSVEIQRQGNVKLGTLNAFQRWQKLLSAGLEQIVTYIPVGNKIYTLSISSPKLDDQMIQTYGLFLATFRLSSASNTPALASSTPKIK